MPPGLPPVEIDGAVYWDGGIYSNSPIDVVLDDADLKVAVECAVNGAFFSTGQKCTATSRASNQKRRIR